ncbi:MAG TPA: bestrophin family ion channel [Cyclobacteriaceae bacterium]|nr:bestrophin family ion channel [Cyclobacteriaceae bacterium]HRJ83955.1 bestrophin family ion channel [Cyclobacteriaceae bacterium]
MLLKKDIPLKYVVGKIKFEFIFVSVYAIIFGLLHNYLNINSITVPIAVPAIVGTIISLLLAFRSNQAYDRWWEARIIWGAIVNDSRTLVRQVITFYRDAGNPEQAAEFKNRFAMRQAAWCYSLGNFLRNHDALLPVKKFLTDEEFKLAARHKHIPNALLMLHGRDIRKALEEGKINSYQQVEIDQTISRLCDAMGKCERIKNTIFPTTYSLYIHFALYLFVLLLPFGLTEYFGFIEAPLVITIASVFFLIEKMAIHLQDPFENKPTDTPVTTIARSIEITLRHMVSEHRDETELKNIDIELPKMEGVYYVM